MQYTKTAPSGKAAFGSTRLVGLVACELCLVCVRLVLQGSCWFREALAYYDHML